MFQLTELFFYKIIFMIELLIMEFIFTFQLKRKRNLLIRSVLSWVGCIVVALLFPLYYYNAWYSSLMFLLLSVVTLAALKFCYEESFVNLIFCAIAAYTAQHLAFEVYSLINTFFSLGKDAMLGIYGDELIDMGTITIETVLQWLIYIEVYLVVYFLVFLFFGKKLRKVEELKIKSTSLLVLGGVALVIDIFINSMLIYVEEDYNVNYSIATCVYNIMCCFLLFYLQFSLINIKKLEDEVVVVERLWQQAKVQYEKSKMNIDLINMKCHDLKYQIRLLGKNERVDNNLIKEIEDMVSVYDSVVRVGNNALDTILTEKSLYCQKNEIMMTCMADGTKLDFIDDADIYVLFGNLVDNAIEATMKIETKEKRVISLNIHQEKNFLLIDVTNYYFEEIEFDEEGLPKTVKKDKENHGFGMRSIKHIAQKYGGVLNVQAKNGLFYCSIIFALKK